MNNFFSNSRVGSRTVAASKMKRFVIIVNCWKPLTSITKRSILHIAAVLDPPLNRAKKLKIPKFDSNDSVDENIKDLVFKAMLKYKNRSSNLPIKNTARAKYFISKK